MTGPAHLVPLAWDSDAFGFAVARIEGVADPQADLPAVPALLARSGTRLAYWEWPSADPTGRAVAVEAGGTFINTRAVLRIDAPTGAVPDAGAIVTDAGPAERDALTALALASGWSSRFALDPRFPRERFKDLYRAWMANSLAGMMADAVIVSRGEDEAIRGVITVSARDHRGQIGLFGVATEARGQGVGGALLRDALGWFAARGCASASVVTQGENEAALAVYHRAGFAIESRTDILHFWKQP